MLSRNVEGGHVRARVHATLVQTTAEGYGIEENFVPIRNTCISPGATARRLREAKSGSPQPNHVSSRNARKASGRFHQAASRAEGSAPLPFLRPQAEPHSCSVSKECRCEGQNLGTFGNDGTFGDDYQSTFTSILLPSGSRTNVERPLPAAPVLTSACVGSRPLRFKVAITS